MPLTTHAHEITYNGRTLAPGDRFEPYPDAHPGYLVTFDGVREGVAYVSDDVRTLGIPVADIPRAKCPAGNLVCSCHAPCPECS